MTQEGFSRARWAPLELPGPGHTFVVATGERLEDTDPATQEPVAVIRSSTAADVSDAVQRGHAAFTSARWRNDGAVRARVLFRYAERLREQIDRLADL